MNLFEFTLRYKFYNQESLNKNHWEKISRVEKIFDDYGIRIILPGSNTNIYLTTIMMLLYDGCFSTQKSAGKHTDLAVPALWCY